MVEKQNPEVKTRNVTDRKVLDVTVSVKSDMPVVTADEVKVMTDADAKLCTLMFFHRHPVPKVGDYGLGLQGIHLEAFLEVKLPLDTAFAIGLYMYGKLQSYANDEPMEGIDFGPSGMHLQVVPPDTETKGQT